MIVTKGDRIKRADRLHIAGETMKIFADLDVDSDVPVITEAEKKEQVDKPYTVTYHAFQEGAGL